MQHRLCLECSYQIN